MASIFKKATVAEWYIRLVLIVSGLIIAAPGIIGMLSVDGLSALYAIDVHSPTTAVLLQHRGVLLAIVGSLLIAASAVRSLRLTAITVGLLSNITFVALTLLEPGAHASLARIAWVDVALTVLLVGAYVAHTKHRKAS